MEYRDPFSDCHPVVALLYFTLVLLFGACILHPVSLSFSLACAVGYGAVLSGRSTVRILWKAVLPMALAAALVNVMFNHRGSTILTYLPTGNPLTLESIAYSGAAALMLASVVIWYGCCASVMTADKWICLFGRVCPALSLVLSMTLRFLPRCKAHYQEVREAQQIWNAPAARNVLYRARESAKIVSVTVSWALENAVDTADSMKSRGYGLPGRTSFSRYRFSARDGWILAWLIFCGGAVLYGWMSGYLRWSWFPGMHGVCDPATVLCLLCYLALCLTPLILHGKEARTWKYLRSAL